MLESFNHQSNWNPVFFEQGGLFELFKPWSDWFLRHFDAFPGLDEINTLMNEGRVAPVLSGGGFPVKCVKQQRIGRAQRDQLGWKAEYQLRIFLSGEVPTRANNWHDFFNAWSWIHLPKTKAAINARHFACAEETYPFPWRRTGGNRNREQDFLTLFDEGGMIVVTENDTLWDMIQNRKWVELFHDMRDELKRDAYFLPVGHALYECALENHPRLHASAVRIKMCANDFISPAGSLSLEALSRADELAALLLSNRSSLQSPEDLHALPIWGLPDWHPRSGDKDFVSDPSYFR